MPEAPSVLVWPETAAMTALSSTPVEDDPVLEVSAEDASSLLPPEVLEDPDSLVEPLAALLLAPLLLALLNHDQSHIFGFRDPSIIVL